jgi:uncharacterized protein (DUF58 family)
MMRPGEDPRDIHWRKSASMGQMVMRERARETRPDVTLSLEVMKSAGAGDEWSAAFERRIRDIASRAVAHLKRGDRVVLTTTAGGLARADRTVGADPLLRYLALIESVESKPQTPAQAAAQ